MTQHYWCVWTTGSAVHSRYLCVNLSGDIRYDTNLTLGILKMPLDQEAKQAANKS